MQACPPRDCTFPDLVLCTFRERPAGGAGVEEKSQGDPGALRPERAGTAEEGMREGDGARRGTGRVEGDGVHGGGRGVRRGTGCAAQDGVCGGGRGAQLRTRRAEGDGVRGSGG